MRSETPFELDPDSDPIQQLRAPLASERFEGLAFSSSGDILAAAMADVNAVCLFRRKADGSFEDAPYCRIGGPDSRLDYPHDVSFSRRGSCEWLAVAQRGGAIAIYEGNGRDERFGPRPAFEIRGPKAGLECSDGVAFVPPNDDYLAACNLTSGSITFYRLVSRDPISFASTPEFTLRHASIDHPDGLAFSRCGRWLAVANHGNHSISIFARRRKVFAGGRIRFGPAPAAVIRDPGLRHPHSVAFTPQANCLIATNAGANYFSAYEPSGGRFGMRWAQSPACQKTVGAEKAFREVNGKNKMEGGPKGIAVHRDHIAVCGPEIGIKIFSFRERDPGARRRQPG
jgi:hypothetical protein